MKEGWYKRLKRPKPEGEEAPSPPPTPERKDQGEKRSWLVVLVGAALGAGILLVGVRGFFGGKTLSPPPAPSQGAPPPPTQPGILPAPPSPVPPPFSQREEGTPDKPEEAPVPVALPLVKAVRDPFGVPPYMSSRKKEETTAEKESLPPLPPPPPPKALPPPSPLEPQKTAEKPLAPFKTKPALRCEATFFGKRAGAVLEADGREFTLLVGESAPGIGTLIGVKPGECLVETKEGRFNLKMEER